MVGIFGCYTIQTRLGDGKVVSVVIPFSGILELVKQDLKFRNSFKLDFDFFEQKRLSKNVETVL